MYGEAILWLCGYPNSIPTINASSKKGLHETSEDEQWKKDSNAFRKTDGMAYTI